MKQLSVTIIDGSPRKESETRKLVHLAKRALEKSSARVTVVDQGTQLLPIFDSEEDKTKDPVISSFFAAVASADILVLSSPEYHGGMSAAIKNALDWLTFVPKEQAMGGKVVGIMGGGGSFANTGAYIQLMMTIRNMHGWLMPEVIMSVPQIWDAFNDKGELISPELNSRLDKFAQRLVHYGKVFEAGKASLIAV